MAASYGIAVVVEETRTVLTEDVAADVPADVAAWGVSNSQPLTILPEDLPNPVG